MEKGRSISVEAGLKRRTLFMKRHPFPLAALILAVALFSVSQRAAHATATANTQLSFTNLAIIPSAGTLSFLTNWTASAYAQAGPANPFNSGTGHASPNAAAAYSLPHLDGLALRPARPRQPVYVRHRPAVSQRRRRLFPRPRRRRRVDPHGPERQR